MSSGRYFYEKAQNELEEEWTRAHELQYESDDDNHAEDYLFAVIVDHYEIEDESIRDALYEEIQAGLS